MPREYIYVQIDEYGCMCGDLAYVRNARKRRISIDANSKTCYSRLLGREGDIINGIICVIIFTTRRHLVEFHDILHACVCACVHIYWVSRVLRRSCSYLRFLQLNRANFAPLTKMLLHQQQLRAVYAQQHFVSRLVSK